MIKTILTINGDLAFTMVEDIHEPLIATQRNRVLSCPRQRHCDDELIKQCIDKKPRERHHRGNNKKITGYPLSIT